MKIAIHHRPDSFSLRWIEYCKESRIPHKIVNCYDNDIIAQLEECDALMWHFHQSNPKDVLFAKQLMYALQTAGKKVFPDFDTCWHFDDKVGQKYLLEAINAPLVPSYVFYEKKTAMEWIGKAEFPKVFKLRRGSGSDHVKLVPDRNTARKLVRRAFGLGFSQYDAASNLRERWRKFKLGKTGVTDVVKGVARLGYTTDFAKVIGNEKGYVYFQDFIAGNDHDIRVNVVDGKAFAVKRGVRKNDFRASGSGLDEFGKQHFDNDMIRLSFEVAEKINSQCLAFDFVYKNNRPLITEISYGFTKDPYYACEGYWDRELNWYESLFDFQGWMIESVVENSQQIH